jgi:hypothetical protein
VSAGFAGDEIVVYELKVELRGILCDKEGVSEKY